MGKRKTSDEFISDAIQIHSDRYDYSLVEYISNKTKVKIICSEHGLFEQTPNHHLKGKGCSVCSGLKKYTIQTFIDKARQVHGDRYDYSLVEYINTETKVFIICNIHGSFKQTPHMHLSGNGCPLCTNGISNQEIEFLNYIKSVYNGEIITNTRSIISPYELDIYLPKDNIAFEYNGMYWHQEGVTKPVGYHQMKIDMCKNKGVELYHIWEDDWIKNKQKIIGFVGHIL